MLDERKNSFTTQHSQASHRIAARLKFNLSPVHPSWQDGIEKSLSSMDPAYLETLARQHRWLPGPAHIFNAFSLPLDQVKVVLFGESPYPRPASAIGYAFWDGAVDALWSDTGLDKKVNRATSLRNIIKMLLLAEGLLTPDTLTQAAIAKVDKSSLVQTNTALFMNLQHHGFLLLNACLALRLGQKSKDATAWRPFIRTLLLFLLEKKPEVTFLFMGNIAFRIEQLLKGHPIQKILVEHPYNHTFVTNQTVLSFFAPLHLLQPV